ncbi:hypothetical protein IC830_06540 [Vibrio parahaemolyticus]|nr:hypothetical protein IC830_06540 [Vibrio parahaemolyticus]
MENILTTLKLDYYYKVILAIAVPVFVSSLTIELMVSNHIVSILSLGAILLGIGEWCNSVPETTVTTQYRITVRNRQNTLLGNAIDTVGLLVILAGVYIAINP